MKNETRANVIFLAIFLALALPGAVILFKRKLDPNAAPMYLPDPVRQRLPYMAPQWTPDEVTRVISPMTAKWVEDVNRQNSRSDQVLMRGQFPVISNDRLLQIVSTKFTSQTLTVYLIAWDNYGIDLRQYDASIRFGGQSQTGKVRTAREISMPDPVRKELMNGGYAMPRHSITWIEAEFAAPPANQQALVLQISYKEGTAATTSSVNLFTQ